MTTFNNSTNNITQDKTLTIAIPSVQTEPKAITLEDCQRLLDKAHEEHLSQLIEETMQTIYEHGLALTRGGSKYAKKIHLNCKRFDRAETLNQKSQLTIMMLLDILDAQSGQYSKSTRHNAVK